MKYQKTIEIWGNEQAILAGRIKLQPGQWVSCGTSRTYPTKSRFVSVKGNVLVIAHGGTNKQVNLKFNSMIQAKRASIKRKI